MRQTARSAVPQLIKLNITPNQLTVGYFTICVPLMTFLFSLNVYAWNIAAIVLLWITRFADHLDGELARARNMVTTFGARLDNCVGCLTTICAFAGIALGMRNAFPVWAITICFLLIVVDIVFRFPNSADEALERDDDAENVGFFTDVFKTLGRPLFLVTTCAIINMPFLAFLSFSILSSFEIIRYLVSLK
jgi:phosphatidylglycerophosphate synthase